MTKRGKLEVMKDILEIIKIHNMIKPTPLLRKSKLSSARFKEYYIELVEKKFIDQITNQKQEKYVILTEKGLKFLEKYKSIVNFIQEFEL